MTKDTFYFRHDCNARQDEKILALRMKLNWEGYGIYWALIERLRESAGYECVKDYNVIAFDLRVPASIIKSVIEDFGLFTFTEDGKRFYSKRLSKDMNTKDEISASRSAAGKKGNEKRWGNSPSDSEEIAKVSQSDRTPIAIKEEERKEYNISSSLCSEENIGAKTDKRFCPPTPEEVLVYAEGRGYAGFDAERFVDFYASKGWMVGKNKMKDWRAAVRNWHKSNSDNPNPPKPSTKHINDEWT